MGNFSSLPSHGIHILMNKTSYTCGTLWCMRRFFDRIYGSTVVAL